MKKIIFLLLLSLSQNQVFAQANSKFDTDPGVFSLGVRSTFSAFNDGVENKVGSGVGGQFRLRFSEKVNSENAFDKLGYTSCILPRLLATCNPTDRLFKVLISVLELNMNHSGTPAFFKLSIRLEAALFFEGKHAVRRE